MTRCNRRWKKTFCWKFISCSSWWWFNSPPKIPPKVNYEKDTCISLLFRHEFGGTFSGLFNRHPGCWTAWCQQRVFHELLGYLVLWRRVTQKSPWSPDLTSPMSPDLTSPMSPHHLIILSSSPTMLPTPSWISWNSPLYMNAGELTIFRGTFVQNWDFFLRVIMIMNSE